MCTGPTTFYLLLARSHAYDFEDKALYITCSYLNEWKQTAHINSSFSSEESAIGVPQGAIDQPLLFELPFNDLLLFLIEIFLCNYADNNTLFKIKRGLVFVKEILKKVFKRVID